LRRTLWEGKGTETGSKDGAERDEEEILFQEQQSWQASPSESISFAYQRNTRQVNPPYVTEVSEEVLHGKKETENTKSRSKKC
jgi:hypothetical protein